MKRDQYEQAIMRKVSVEHEAKEDLFNELKTLQAGQALDTMVLPKEVEHLLGLRGFTSLFQTYFKEDGDKQKVFKGKLDDALALAKKYRTRPVDYDFTADIIDGLNRIMSNRADVGKESLPDTDLRIYVASTPRMISYLIVSVASAAAGGKEYKLVEAMTEYLPEFQLDMSVSKKLCKAVIRALEVLVKSDNVKRVTVLVDASDLVNLKKLVGEYDSVKKFFEEPADPDDDELLQFVELKENPAKAVCARDCQRVPFVSQKESMARVLRIVVKRLCTETQVKFRRLKQERKLEVQARKRKVVEGLTGRMEESKKSRRR